MDENISKFIKPHYAKTTYSDISVQRVVVIHEQKKYQKSGIVLMKEISDGN